MLKNNTQENDNYEKDYAIIKFNIIFFFFW